MPCFRVFFQGDETAHDYVGANPHDVRRKATREDGRPIRKIKLDRETVDSSHRAPRLTRRELRKEPSMSLAEQVMSANARFAAAKAAIETTNKRQFVEPCTDEDADAVAKMVAHMQDIEAIKGSVEQDDLLTRGWTLDDIHRHGGAARDRANAMRERVI